MADERNIRIEVPNPGADLVLVEGSIPECPPHGVIVKTSSSGMCHSDVHIWLDQWHVADNVTVSYTAFSDKVKWPMILGHEICGVVHAIGKNATGKPENLSIGDQVVVFPWIGCGDCRTCKDGRSNDCPAGGLLTDIGLGVVPGGYQLYVPVSRKDYVLPVSTDVPPHIACMFACSALTAYHAVCQSKRSIERASRSGEAHYLVIGAGGLGLWCVQIAKAIYPPNTKIFVADISEEKLALAKEYGADEGILWPIGGDEKELTEKTQQMTGGVDGSADFVAIPPTCTKAFEVSNKGATMCIVGLAGGTWPLSIFQIITKDITIRGTVTGNQSQMAELVELYKNKKLVPPPLMDIRPEEASKALHDLHQGKIPGRVIINF